MRSSGKMVPCEHTSSVLNEGVASIYFYHAAELHPILSQNGSAKLNPNDNPFTPQSQTLHCKKVYVATVGKEHNITRPESS